MGAFVDTATDVISRAAQRVETSAQNLANITTAGYRRRLDFGSLLATDETSAAPARAIDLTPGKLQVTGAPYDLAIQGSGFFVVASKAGVFYTRAGQFQRDGDGRLVNAAGQALQTDDGGDLILRDTGPVKVLEDGTVTEGGRPSGKIAVVAFNDNQTTDYVDGGVLTAPASGVTSIDTPSVRQGAIEASNVSNAAGMISIMQSLRQAEAGQKLVNVYDDLMSRLLSTLGQAGNG